MLLLLPASGKMGDDGPTQFPEICMGLAVFWELSHLLFKPKGKASRLGHLFPGVTDLCCGCGTEADETELRPSWLLGGGGTQGRSGWGL